MNILARTRMRVMRGIEERIIGDGFEDAMRVKICHASVGFSEFLSRALLSFVPPMLACK